METLVLWKSTRNISLARPQHRKIAASRYQENSGLFEHLLKIKDFNFEPESQAYFETEEWLKIKFVLLFTLFLLTRPAKFTRLKCGIIQTRMRKGSNFIKTDKHMINLGVLAVEMIYDIHWNDIPCWICKRLE